MIDDLRTSAHLIYHRHIKGSAAWQDDPTMIAAYLRPRLKEGDYIYVVDGQPIIYFLTNAKIPTRYPFPPFLVLRPDLLNITGVVPVRELDKIVEKTPSGEAQSRLVLHGLRQGKQAFCDLGRDD